ncbi:MAG: hypothetical protein H8E34_08685 [Bacteroidetes bacterium]|nr:hypothetical protein [Bacteroidota bacterium]MBL6944294.1 hypothetical protein [Bacteroidales bacterium]
MTTKTTCLTGTAGRQRQPLSHNSLSTKVAIYQQKMMVTIVISYNF